MAMNDVKVYGADWCGDTQNTLAHLDELGITYDYINIEQDREAANWVKEQNDGKERKPTLKVGERVLSTPSDDELDDALRGEGLIDDK